MSVGYEHADLGGGSAESSCVRFAEYIAGKLEAGRVVMGLDERETARERLGATEAARLYGEVTALVRGGADGHAACSRVGVSFDGYRQWAWRQGMKVRKAPGRASR